MANLKQISGEYLEAHFSLSPWSAYGLLLKWETLGLRGVPRSYRLHCPSYLLFLLHLRV